MSFPLQSSPSAGSSSPPWPTRSLLTWRTIRPEPTIHERSLQAERDAGFVFRGWRLLPGYYIFDAQWLGPGGSGWLVHRIGEPRSRVASD